MGKYMLVMRASDETFEAMTSVPFEEMLETIGRFNEELIKPGCCSRPRGSIPRSASWWTTRRPSPGHGRAVRGDQGAVRRVLSDQRPHD